MYVGIAILHGVVYTNLLYISPQCLYKMLMAECIALRVVIIFIMQVVSPFLNLAISPLPTLEANFLHCQQILPVVATSRSRPR